MDLVDARLLSRGADSEKPRAPDQKVQPPHALPQLLPSLDGVRKPVNPFMERGGDHSLGGARKRRPFDFRDLTPQRRMECLKNVKEGDVGRFGSDCDGPRQRFRQQSDGGGRRMYSGLVEKQEVNALEGAGRQRGSAIAAERGGVGS